MEQQELDTESQKTTDPWAKASNVLCVRLDSIGDVLMTSPAIRALKQSVAGRSVTILTSTGGAPAARLIPDVDEVIVYDAPWVKNPLAADTSAPDLAMIRKLKEKSFDAAVIFTVYSQNPLPAAMLCHLADIPLRLAHCHENPYRLLTDWVPDPEPSGLVRHEVRRQLDLVAAVGATIEDERLSLRIGPAAHQTVGRWLESAHVDRRHGWCVVHPGASAESRRYPPDLFSRVVRGLVLELGLQVVLSGGPSERELVEEIARQSGVPTVSAAGVFDLEELGALVTRAPVLVANNSGPVHVAAAVGTPVVDLYALTNPQHTPWAVLGRVLSHQVPCAPCYKSVCPEGHHNCLRLVDPTEVIQATRELLVISEAPA